MKRSSNSFTSLTSIYSSPSINSTTKMYNNRDLQKYIANMEEDIMKVSNDYYYLTEKYDKKINNIINRYEGRTNKLYIDLRNRDCDYKTLNKKVDNIIKEFNEYKYQYLLTINKPINISISYDDDNIKYILVSLYIYTSLVLSIIINYYCILK